MANGFSISGCIIKYNACLIYLLAVFLVLICHGKSNYWVASQYPSKQVFNTPTLSVVGNCHRTGLGCNKNQKLLIIEYLTQKHKPNDPRATSCQDKVKVCAGLRLAKIIELLSCPFLFIDGVTFSKFTNRKVFGAQVAAKLATLYQIKRELN